MPLYEYKCDACGDVFEVLQRFSDAPLIVHQECGGPVHRLISRSALQFKGSGWYITDYARSGGKSEGNGSEKSESKADTKSESKPESKQDAKPASKSEAKSESKSDASSSGKSTTESTK